MLVRVFSTLAKHKATTSMASNIILVVLLVFVSLSLTSGYSFFTRDAVSKQDDESYVTATSDQESSMVVVEDLVKGRLLARVARSEVVVNKAVSKNSPSKSSKKKDKSSKKKHKSIKIGSLQLAVGAFVGIIIAAIVAIIVIIVVIYFILALYLRHKTKKAQSTEQETATEKINGSSETQTSKSEDV